MCILQNQRRIVVSDTNNEIVHVDIFVVGMLQIDVLRHHIMVDESILPTPKNVRLEHIVVARSHDDRLRSVPVSAVEYELRPRR
jgi:hypothetical protein